jgi:hypothetical protein
VALLQSAAADIKRASAFVNTCLEQHTLQPIVSLELPYREAAAAHTEVINKDIVKVGNIVLSW